MTALQVVRLFDGFDVFDHRKHIKGCYRQLRDHRPVGKVVFDLDCVGVIGFENVNVIDVEIAELAVFPQFPPLSDLIPPGWGFDLLVHRLSSGLISRRSGVVAQEPSGGLHPEPAWLLRLVVNVHCRLFCSIRLTHLYLSVDSFGVVCFAKRGQHILFMDLMQQILFIGLISDIGRYSVVSPFTRPIFVTS